MKLLLNCVAKDNSDLGNNIDDYLIVKDEMVSEL